MTRRRSSNRIPGLTQRTLAGGVAAFGWSPTPRQRRLGWTFLDFGRISKGDAATLAIARNAEVLALDQQRVVAVDPASVKPPRHWTFGELLDDCEAEWSARVAAGSMSAKTRKEYRSQGRWLRRWANDGQLMVHRITDAIVEDLRDTLVAHASAYTAPARLRVLRIILARAVKPLRLIAANPAAGVNAPAAPTRKKRILIETVHHLADHAAKTGFPHVSMAILTGFYTLQREEDLLAATRFNWRRMDDMAPADRVALGDASGQPWGVRLQQIKTRQWIDALVPGTIADIVGKHWTAQQALAEARAASIGQTVASDPHALRLVAMPFTGETVPDWRLQRDFRAVVTAAREAAQAKGDDWLTAQLTGLQYRDLRRSGMCWLRDMGATIPMIASQSGHSIAYTQKILDTYMPGDQRASAAGVATALRNAAAQAATIEREQQP